MRLELGKNCERKYKYKLYRCIESGLNMERVLLLGLKWKLGELEKDWKSLEQNT